MRRLSNSNTWRSISALKTTALPIVLLWPRFPISAKKPGSPLVCNPVYPCVCLFQLHFPATLVTLLLALFVGARVSRVMCVPYLGVLLSDIVFTEDGNTNTVKVGSEEAGDKREHINFVKCRR